MLSLKKTVLILFVLFLVFSGFLHSRISVDITLNALISNVDLVEEFVNSIKLNLKDRGVLFTPPFTDRVLLSFLDKKDRFELRISINEKNFFTKSFTSEEYRAVSYSSYLNIMESLALSGIKNLLPGNELRLTYYDSVNEYPYFDSHYLYFISDRLTGNTNIFFRDMDDMKIGMVEMPLSAEAFPVTSNGEIYFLKIAVENPEICRMISGSQTSSYSKVILKGDISCLRECGNRIYASVENGIFAYDDQKNIWNSVFELKKSERIQSFDISGNSMVISVLKESQYDVLLVDMKKKDVVELISTPYNEMDIRISKDANEMAFSSNKFGNYDIFLLDIDTGLETRLTKKDSDDFYPCFTTNTGSLVFSRYERNSEPFLVAVAY